MKDLPLNALRVFALACAKGGVRSAARELGIAHSSVSRHLAELEKWLGVPLSR
jgi:LysR family glycine cleavage system transcriptional activator